MIRPGLLSVLLLGLLVTAARAEEERSKKIEFENEVIEGENRRSMDSLTQFSEGADKKTRLYEKRQNFQDEDQELLRYLTEEK